MIEVEQNLLGALIVDSSRITEIDISPADFSTEAGRMIYQAMLDLEASSEVIDTLTLGTYLENTTGRKWLASLGSIVQNTITAANAKAYARIVRSNANDRKVAQVADMLREKPGSIDEAIRELMSLNTSRRNFEYSMKQVMHSTIDALDAAHKSGGLTGISTGLEDIDDALGGFQNSDFIVIGGRPGMGKTAMMLNLVDRCDVPCGIISAEQGHDQMGGRMLAINGRVSVHKMRRAKLDDDDWNKITMSLGRLGERNTWINDKPSPSIEEVIRQARKWKYQHDIKILFIDYIQRMKGRGPSIRERIGDICRSLKELARELDIPVIALSQVTREVEKRTNKRPTIADLKEAGEIEQEADEILLLYRDEVYNEDSPNRGVLEINIGKNRHGPTGLIRTVWRGECMRVENFAHVV